MTFEYELSRKRHQSWDVGGQSFEMVLDLGYWTLIHTDDEWKGTKMSPIFHLSAGQTGETSSEEFSLRHVESSGPISCLESSPSLFGLSSRSTSFQKRPGTPSIHAGCAAHTLTQIPPGMFIQSLVPTTCGNCSSCLGYTGKQNKQTSLPLPLEQGAINIIIINITNEKG